MLEKEIKIWKWKGWGANARLTPYPSDVKNAPSCIVCPGGSYFWLDCYNESIAAARWLQANGINAFVLRYRVAGKWAFFTRLRLWGHARRARRVNDDIHRAMQVIRCRSAEWNVAPDSPLGVMGFSAGGHAALMAGIHYASTEERPDFVAAIYPVVTMTGDAVHTRSRRGLIGDFPERHRALTEHWSAQLTCHKEMSPTFLVSCEDDPVVDNRNVPILVRAMENKGIPATHHRYAAGGHGFGANDDAMPAATRAWKPAFLQWLNSLLTSDSNLK